MPHTTHSLNSAQKTQSSVFVCVFIVIGNSHGHTTLAIRLEENYFLRPPQTEAAPLKIQFFNALKERF